MSTSKKYCAHSGINEHLQKGEIHKAIAEVGEVELSKRPDCLSAILGKLRDFKDKPDWQSWLDASLSALVGKAIELGELGLAQEACNEISSLSEKKPLVQGAIDLALAIKIDMSRGADPISEN